MFYRIGCYFLLLAAHVGICCFTGCAKSDPRVVGLVPGAGVVLIDDVPLEGAAIVFHNIETPSQQGGSAISGAGGKFALTTFLESDGIHPAKYCVTVIKTRMVSLVSDEEVTRLERERQPVPAEKEEWFTPESYSKKETTPLEVTIPPSGDRQIKLTITGKPGK